MLQSEHYVPVIYTFILPLLCVWPIYYLTMISDHHVLSSVYYYYHLQLLYNVLCSSFPQCPEDAWDKIFEVNVKNALQITQLAVPHIQKRKGGAIVYISSFTG